MASIMFKPGEAEPLAIQPEQEDGATPDLTGVSVQLRVQSGATCIALDGVLDAEGQLFEVDLNTLDLPPRLYPATIYFDWGDGYRHTGHLNLIVEGGC